MHKINYFSEPDFYKNRIKKYARWSGFSGSRLYYEVVKLLENNQNHLCAYCECEVREKDRQIEHFVPKDLDNSKEFAFENFLLACLGGSAHFRGKNISCGQHKGNSSQKILNPYTMPEICLFEGELVLTFKKYYLRANVQNCQATNTPVELVNQTLEVLNLNCDRLAKIRYKIYKKLEHELRNTYIREDRLLLEKQQLQAENHKLKSFYTTRLLCIEDNPFY